jgi:Lipase (class 3)
MNISGFGLALLICCALSACVSIPPISESTQRMSAVDTSWKQDKGFNLSEAKALIEFCTALDYGQKEYVGNIPKPANAAGWEAVYPYHETLPANRDPNTVGPYDNAWKLYKKMNSDIYVIAIRGTIDTKGSIIDDVIATSISAKVRLPIDQNRSLSFTLAETPQAETHLGWTYAMAELMFNADFGILKALHAGLIPKGSRVLITGHSQGAAVATLVHAFLHYAISDPSDKFGLRDSGYTLKSYVFAQPKPGNWQFAMDFARIAASRGTAFVINNNKDWVPQVPLSIEFVDEPGADLLVQLAKPPGLEGVVSSMLATGAIGFAEGSRAFISLKVQEDTIKSILQGHRLDDRYLEERGPGDIVRAYSVNYAVAGTQVPVFGSAAPAGAIPNDGPLSQHHGPTYRTLLELPEALGGPPHTLDKPASYAGM